MGAQEVSDCQGAVMSWKKMERRVAQMIGGERTAKHGLASPDAGNEWLSVECKFRRALPKWLHQAMAQAVRNAPSGRLPIVWLHERYKKKEDDFVVIRAGDFQEWFGGWPGREE